MPYWVNEKKTLKVPIERVDLTPSSPIIAPLPASNGLETLFFSKV